MLYILVIFVALAWCWPVVADLLLLAAAHVALSEYESEKHDETR